MKIKPTRSQMLVKPVKEDEYSKGGIFLGAASAQEVQCEFDVLAVGRGTFNKQGEIIVPDVFPGCRVIANRWAGVEVEYNGSKCRLMESTSAIAIVFKEKSAVKDQSSPVSEVVSASV